MANLPIPLGISVTLTDIAKGIGDAARTIPERSRSEVGALAVKRALVQLDFELAVATSRSSQGVEAGPTLGVRTVRFGAGVASETRTSTGVSRGHIELEVVAIQDVAKNADDDESPEREPPAPPKGDDNPKPGQRPDLEEPSIDVGDLRAAVEIWGRRLASGLLSQKDQQAVSDAIRHVEALLARGDVAGAAQLLAQLAVEYDQLEGVALRETIATLRAVTAKAQLDTALRARVDRALDEARASLDAGDAARATHLLAMLRPVLARVDEQRKSPK
jgi:hypothetical protein